MGQVQLNRNEVMQGPAPKVLDVIRNFDSSHLNLYLPGYSNSLLIRRLSELYKLPEEQIIVSYGEEDFFRTVFNTLDPQSDVVLMHNQHYSYYDIYLGFRNVNLKTFKLEQKEELFVFSVDDCIAQYQATRPRVILITSPNNPTGNSISSGDLEKILRQASPEVLVVVDEAYWGFDNTYEERNFLSLLGKFPNLVFLRSFSKLYALAGLRISYALCGRDFKASIGYQNRYLGLSRISEEAALAALDSQDYYKKISKEIIQDRDGFISVVRTLKHFKAYDSVANFVLIRAEGLQAKLLKDRLLVELEIIAKPVGEDLFRVTIGDDVRTHKFVAILSEIDRVSGTK